MLVHVSLRSLCVLVLCPLTLAHPALGSLIAPPPPLVLQHCMTFHRTYVQSGSHHYVPNRYRGDQDHPFSAYLAMISYLTAFQIGGLLFLGE